MDDLLSFIKSDGSPLVNLIKLVVITFSIWMIWHMRNYVRFQVKIDISRTISTIKDFTCLVGNSSKSFMKNDMFDFNVLKFFDINTHSGKFLHPLHVRWEFPSLGLVKINIDGVVRGYPDFVAFGGIFRESMGKFIDFFWLSLIFELLWLLSLLKLYMPLMKLKRWILLVYGLNVVLP